MELLDFRELANTIKSFQGKQVTLAFHSIGDSDGVGSAIALSSLFKNSRIMTPDFITHNARELLLLAGYKEKLDTKFPPNTEVLIITDTNNFYELGKLTKSLSDFTGEILFIDHHLLPKGDIGKVKIFNNEDYNSTSSIIYDLFLEMGVEPTRQAALLLLDGIIADSAEFRNATKLTFRQISELLGYSGKSFTEILEFFHESVPLERRNSLINEIQNSKLETVGNYLLIYGIAESHANIAADMAIRIGTDAALFWTIRKEEFSISARLRPPLDKRLNFHLGTVMQVVGEMISGNGGGHPCAAGAYGPGKERSEEAIKKALREIRKALNG